MSSEAEATQVYMRRYSVKLYPNKTQLARMNDLRGLHQRLWNALVYQRKDAWYRCGVSLTHFDQSKEITKLRAVDPEYRSANADSLAITAKRVDLAFARWYKNVKDYRKGVMSSAPNPPSDERGYFSIPGWGYRGGDKNRWKLGQREDWRAGKVYLPDIGKVKWRGAFPEKPLVVKTCEVVYSEDGIYLSIACEMQARRNAGSDAIRVRMDDLIEEFIRVERVNGADVPPDDISDIVESSVKSWCNGDTGTDHPDLRGEYGGRNRFSSPMYGTDHPDLRGEYGVHTIDGALIGGTDHPDLRGEYGVHTIDGALIGGTDHPDLRGEYGKLPGNMPATFGTDHPETTGEYGCFGSWSLSCWGTDHPETTGELRMSVAACNGPSRGKKNRRHKKRMDALRDARRSKDAVHVQTARILNTAKEIELHRPKDLKELTKSGRGDVKEWGAAVKTKARINRHILDQCPGAFIDALHYKAEEAGVTIHEVMVETKADVGNKIVDGVKAVRKARRTINNKQKEFA